MKRGTKKWVLAGLIICLISMIGSSVIQTNFGNVKVEELTWVGSGGYKTSALLYKPDTATKESKVPCIITVEGWYNNKEMQDLYSVEYARRGFVVLAVDMHGHGDSESTTAAELYSDAVGVNTAVELASNLPYVDTSRIAVTGHSSGGAACGMAVALDNERKTPLISAVLYEASTWVDDTGKDHSADFGSRSVGIISDKYDEFFFWTKDEKGNTVAPRDFLTTSDAKNFVNFNNGPNAIKESVEPGKFYEQQIDGKTAYRTIFQEACTHPWVHFSKACVSYGISFFDNVFHFSKQISPSNQIWQVKTAFNFIGIIGFFMFIINFAIAMLDTQYFASLKANEPVKPLAVMHKKGRLWFWIPLALCALFSGLSYMWAINNVYAKTTKLFVQTGPLTMGAWCVISGLFTLIALVVYYYCYGKKNGVSLVDRGVHISLNKLFKTVVLSVLAAGAGFLVLFFADYFFKTDFRIWVLTLKAFNADKVIIGLVYLPFFLLFYIINSISTNCINYNDIGGKKGIGNLLILAIFNALGPIVFVIIQYSTFLSTGLLKWYETEGLRISGIWLYPVIVYLIITPFITRYVYKRTNNPYLCAMINAIIITMMSVANTTTILGGAAVVASNY
jgi:pimeloyl-ACP methyl ester carboxylesterase